MLVCNHCCYAEETQNVQLENIEKPKNDFSRSNEVNNVEVNENPNSLPKGRWGGILKGVAFPTNGEEVILDSPYAFTNCDNKAYVWVQQKDSEKFTALKGESKISSLLGTHLLTILRAEPTTGDWVESFSWSFIEDKKNRLIVRGSRTVWNKSDEAKNKTFGRVLYGIFKKISDECDTTLVVHNLVKVKNAPFILTEEAKQKNLNGEVNFSYEVNSTGDLANIQILRSPHPILSDIVLKTLAEWKMAPPSPYSVKSRATFIIDSFTFK